MKIRTNDIAAWVYADDVIAGTVRIETRESPHSRKQQNVNVAIAEIAETVLILAAVAVVWLPIMVMLWP